MTNLIGCKPQQFSAGYRHLFLYGTKADNHDDLVVEAHVAGKHRTDGSVVLLDSDLKALEKF